MPYVDPPENVIPGKPKYYATAIPVNGVAEGVIVESHGPANEGGGQSRSPGKPGCDFAYSHRHV